MVTVSTEVARLDVDTVHRWLSTDAYWAPGASTRVGTAAGGARSYAAADGPGGAASVVSATADAHGLYAKFGFEPMSQPERWMLRTYLP